ncbi:MAG: DHH family phosphoesterase [bacterium]|nr:DHH family phosphoesterase [bacterium]
MSKRWVIPETVSEEVKAKFPEYSGVLLQLLWNRGLRTQEEMDVYLGPDWSRDTYDPFLFNNMPEAVKRVFDALDAGQVITVHGDYDADGTCGTAVLVSTLRDLCRKFGYDEALVTYYIPHREKEGYGVSVSSMDLFHKEWHTGLVITVDCGISNKEAIDHAKTLGIDTIVCDHHAMPKELPEQAILIHPLVPGEAFPNKNLCGTAVAFKLASGLIIEARKRGADLPEGYEKWLLDLVAIATVTDVMQLTGENRVLEKYGLMVLNKTRRIGLQKLLEVSGAKLGELDTVSIGFVIGPRINAAGRMEHAHEALKLLIAEDELEATTQAMRLHDINKERQRVSRKAYLEAKQQVGEVADQKILIAANPDWRAGVVGLIAGRLSNDYSLPVFVVHQHEDKFMGSGRSVEGFDPSL